MVAGCNHKKKRRAQLCAERILPIWGTLSRQDESPIPASNDAQKANTGALRALRLLVGKREIGKNQYSETSKLSFRKFSGSYWKINRDLVAGSGELWEGTQKRAAGYRSNLAASTWKVRKAQFWALRVSIQTEQRNVHNVHGGASCLIFPFFLIPHSVPSAS